MPRLPRSRLFPYTTLFRSDGGGGDVDDPPTALLPHLGDDRLAGQPDTTHVDGHQLVPLRLADFPEGLHRDGREDRQDRKSTRLNSSHTVISYAVFCLKKT